MYYNLSDRVGRTAAGYTAATVTGTDCVSMRSVRSVGSPVSMTLSPRLTAKAATIASVAEMSPARPVAVLMCAASRAVGSLTGRTWHIRSRWFSWKSRRWSPVRTSTRTTLGTCGGQAPRRRSSANRARCPASAVTPPLSSTRFTRFVGVSGPRAERGSGRGRPMLSPRRLLRDRWVRVQPRVSPGRCRERPPSSDDRVLRSMRSSRLVTHSDRPGALGQRRRRGR